MKSKKINLIKEISLILLSFFIPFVTLIILLNVHHIALGGYDNLTILMMDMQSQYICYIRDLRYMLLHGGSFVYTTEKVFGGDYLSIFTYYLSSPFNLFVVFFSEEAIPLFFVWSNIIKMCFASLNFYLLVRITGKFSYHKIIFAIGYGLISFSLVYMSNFMWLDGVMILPLVVLGIHLLKERKHLWVYPLAIAYSLMSSWYIGFMVCIFSVIYFLCYYAKVFSLKENKHECITFPIRYFVFSLLGGLLSVTYWFVAFMHLSGTKAFSELPPLKYFSLSMLISGFLENNYPTHNMITQYNSYFSMFVGIVPLVFFITFFCNKKFTFRERIAYGLMFIFYIIMSSNTVTTALLHGGKEPTWFPGRYAFILGFIVCYLGSRSMDEAKDLHPAFYSVPTLVGIACLLIVKFNVHSERLAYYPISVPSVVMYFVTVVFAFLISLFNYLPHEKLKAIKPYLPHMLSLLIVVQIISLYRGADKVIKVNVEDKQYQTYETYLKDTAYSASFDKIKKYDKDTFDSAFYRMESTFNRPGNYNQIDNNPMFYSYSGLSNFSSSSKQDVESYMSKLGYHYNGFFTKFQAGSTYSISTLLGIKYILDDPSEHKNYPYYLDYSPMTKLDLEDDKVNYYYNINAVTLGFVSNQTNAYFINEGRRINDDYVYWFDHFEYQNSIFRTIDNKIDEDIFKRLTINDIKTTIEYTEDICGIRTYKNIKKGQSIRIEFSEPEEGKNYPLYISENSYYQNANFYVDGRDYPINTYWNKGIFSFPHNSSGKHSLLIIFKEDAGQASIRPELYYEDLAVSQKYFNKIKEQELFIDKSENGIAKKAFVGHINLTDNNKQLIVTLPYEKGIRVYVDGKRAMTEQKFNIFTSIDLSKYELGEHKIRIEYKDSALTAAVVVFSVSLPLSILSFIFYTNLENKVLAYFDKRKKKSSKDEEEIMIV